MQEITINEKKYLITFTEDSVEVEFQDEKTGLKTVYVFEELVITKKGITTEIHQFQLSPTGERIDLKKYKRSTFKNDRDNFINSPIADLILKFITNGIFRFLIQSTHKVYDMSGNLIIEQPVLPPDKTTES